jgi:hypothetical protein
MRSAAIDITVDTIAQVLRAHRISAASLIMLPSDATDGEWTESAARILLLQALEPPSTERRWWKLSTWRLFSKLWDPVFSRSSSAR